MNKIIVSDLDGTLLRNDKTVSQEAIDLLKDISSINKDGRRYFKIYKKRIIMLWGIKNIFILFTNYVKYDILKT